jgi:hypothetical protein
MLINVTSTDQTIYIFISDGGASVIVGDRAMQATSKGGGRVWSWSPGNVLGFSCILDTFYDSLKVTDLVYFISWMKTLRGYRPPRPRVVIPPPSGDGSN